MPFPCNTYCTMGVRLTPKMLASPAHATTAALWRCSTRQRRGQTLHRRSTRGAGRRPGNGCDRPVARGERYATIGSEAGGWTQASPSTPPPSPTERPDAPRLGAAATEHDRCLTHFCDDHNRSAKEKQRLTPQQLLWSAGDVVSSPAVHQQDGVNLSTGAALELKARRGGPEAFRQAVGGGCQSGLGAVSVGYKCH